MQTSDDRPLILFDGFCHLCSWSVRFVLWADRHHRFRFATMSSELGMDLLGREGLIEEDSIVLWDDGRIGLRSEAVFRILNTLGWPWRAALILKVFPRTWRDGFYSFVARRRRQWFGRRKTCMPPPERYRSRFMD